LIHFTQLRKIRNGNAQDTTGFQDPAPFAQDTLDVAALEVLQDMTVVDQIHAVIRNERQVVYRRDVIDMRVINGINMYETGNMPLAAAKM
jgi:hypothetical protein